MESKQETDKKVHFTYATKDYGTGYVSFFVWIYDGKTHDPYGFQALREFLSKDAEKLVTTTGPIHLGVANLSKIKCWGIPVSCGYYTNIVAKKILENLNMENFKEDKN